MSWEATWAHTGGCELRWNPEEVFCLMADEFVTDCKVKHCTKSLQTPRCSARGAGLSSQWGMSWTSHSCLSLSFLIWPGQAATFRRMNECQQGFHFWVICCILDDSWHSSHPALARKTRGLVLTKEAGVREHQRLKDAQRRVWALFPWRAGPAKPIRAPEQLWASEAAGSEGSSNGSFHTLSPTSLLCVKIQTPNQTPISFFFHSPAHLPLLFSLFYPNS